MIKDLFVDQGEFQLTIGIFLPDLKSEKDSPSKAVIARYKNWFYSENEFYSFVKSFCIDEHGSVMNGKLSW